MARVRDVGFGWFELWDGLRSDIRMWYEMGAQSSPAAICEQGLVRLDRLQVPRPCPASTASRKSYCSSHTSSAHACARAGAHRRTGAKRADVLGCADEGGCVRYGGGCTGELREQRQQLVQLHWTSDWNQASSGHTFRVPPFATGRYPQVGRGVPAADVPLAHVELLLRFDHPRS